MSDFNALDLDSLDALLDAAEVGPENEISEPAQEPPQETVAPKVTEVQEATTDSNIASAAQDELLAMTPAVNKQNKPLKSDFNESSVPAKEPPSLKAGKSIEKWTDAEMDSIKKLIIIFGSVLIVLALTVIGLATANLFSVPKADANLMEQVEAIKNEVGQSYLVIEDSGKKAKTMSGQLSDVATQLAEVAEAIEILKAKTATITTANAKVNGKPMTAAERKAALRGEIQHNLAQGITDENNDPEAEVTTNQKVDKVVNSAQAEQIVADIVDMKKRLVATQKVLENLHKQSEMLQQQSQLVTDTLKNVEIDVKALKPVPKVASAPKAPMVKKVEDKEVAPKAEVKPIKPADDPEWRARWSQQMGKSDGFP